MSAIFHIKEHTIEGSHIREYPRATAESQDDALLLHIKQYTPKDNPAPKKGDVTIIGAHANGFPKELYEPLWEDFYHEAKKRNIRIRGIWICDTAWQGRSGILNEKKLGNDPGWYDYARDIIHMVNTFRMPRPLLAIGHSFGANAITNASFLHPRLFNGIVLMEPIIMGFTSRLEAIRQGPGGKSMYRRDTWPTRQEAVDSFKKSKFYQGWDPRVLDRWLEFGLRSGADGKEDGETTLSTTKHQEVFTYFRPSWPAFDESGNEVTHPERCPDIENPTYPLYRAEGDNTVQRLAHIRPSVLFVYGATSDISTSGVMEENHEITGTGVGGSGGRKAGRVNTLTAPGSGHLVAMDAPTYCARNAAEFVEREVERWWVDEREYEEWTKKPLAEKSTILDEYRERIGVPETVQTRNKAKI